MSIFYSKGDIHVQKIKVKNAFFYFSASSHVFPVIDFDSININVCMVLN